MNNSIGLNFSAKTMWIKWEGKHRLGEIICKRHIL